MKIKYNSTFDYWYAKSFNHYYIYERCKNTEWCFNMPQGYIYPDEIKVKQK